MPEIFEQVVDGKRVRVWQSTDQDGTYWRVTVNGQPMTDKHRVRQHAINQARNLIRDYGAIPHDFDYR